jgi:predicted deacylase
MPITQISADVDYQLLGKQQGSLRVPYSSNKAGWANLLIPITVVKNGHGPTVLALGGNHGDEYEGPVALMKLARLLQPNDVSGCLILIPALNLPAVLAGTRLSPIDGLNLNRAFPGRYNDTVTGLIAHYLTQVLFPLADVVMDLHSGGKSMDFFPCAHLHRVSDDAQFQRMLAAAKVWGMPYVFIYADIAGEGLLPVQAESMGKIVVTTEMGGAGQCSPRVVSITERGVRNVLIHLGLLRGHIDVPSPNPTVVAATRREDYHLAPANGIYESFFEVGEQVE